MSIAYILTLHMLLSMEGLWHGWHEHAHGYWEVDSSSVCPVRSDVAQLIMTDKTVRVELGTCKITFSPIVF